MFAVLILLLSSSNLAELRTPQNHVTTDLNPITSGAVPYTPYLSNPGSYPLPDILPNETGSVMLPQLATQVIASIPVYQLAFAKSIPGIGNVLELQTGEYNASLAQSIYLSGFCRTSCSNHLPIVWDAPVPIAAYGGATIQGDAIAAEGAWTFVAASSNNQTAVFFTGNYGTNGSWYSLTGNHPVSGASPKLVASACTALLTTLTASNLIATTFSLPCGRPWSPPPPPPVPTPPNGGGGHPPGGAPPMVSILLPSQSGSLSYIQINGTGYSGVTQVLFGGAPSPTYTVISSTAISARVPGGAGLVPVQVFTSTGGGSPQTCADLFNYGTALTADTPEVSAVFPAAAPAGSTVQISGAYFQGTSTVNFGITAATGVTLLSPGLLRATVPLGTGTVNVTVTNTVGTSPTFGCADLFTIQAIPSVISVTPDQGPAGQSEIIEGRNFLSSASAYFGATVATSTSYYNNTLLTAIAPAGSGTVNVSVHQVGYTSALTCADNFTYGAAPPSLAPQVEWVTPVRNASFGSMVVAGYNFQPNATVLFGGVPTPRVYYATSTLLQVEVPLGVGAVPVQVSESAGTSLLTCADRFTIQWPAPLANFTAHTWTLPKALGADPVVIGGNPYFGVSLLGSGSTEAIFASNASTSEVVFYQLNGTGAGRWVPTNVAPFASFNASSPVTSLGQTSLSVPNGTSGQVAAAAFGQSIFGLFTTYFNGQTVAETVGSVNGGTTWAGPYAASPGVASIRDPEAAVSPSGYIYVTWRENAFGPWAVDQAVYWPSGVPLSAPVALKGSWGPPTLSAGPPTVLVDPFGRPFFAWTFTTPVASIAEYTGAFVSGFTALEAARAGFNATVPADFENFGGPGIHSLRAAINTTLGLLENDTSNVSRLCMSQQVSYGRLYPNITTIDPAAVVLGPALHSCPLNLGRDNSFLVAYSGPFAADVYLEVETSNLLESLGLGSMPIPPWLTGLYAPPPLTGGAFVPGTGAKWASSTGSAIQITPITLNSGTVFLNATGVFWQRTGATNNTHNATTVCGTTSNVDGPSGYSTNLTIKNQAGSTTAVYTFNSSTQLPDVYVDNLRALRNGTWTEKVSVNYVDTQTSTNNCPSSFGFSNYTRTVTPPSGWPKTFTQSLTGTYTTGLGYYPSNVTLNSTGVKGSSTVMNDTAAWQNTIYAVAKAWLNQTSGTNPYKVSWSNGTYQLPEYVQGSGFQTVPVGKPFKFQALLQTKNSTVNSSWWPLLNGNQVSITQPVETLKYTCTFNQLANYQKLWWYSPPSSQPNNITNVTAAGATITWFSNGNNSGWVAYTLSNGYELNQTAVVYRMGNGSFEYVAQLNGLEPWSVYYAVAHVRTASGCAVYQNQTNVWRFQTQATIPLAEQDLPYDSITGEGGGGQLFFQIPESFSQVSTYLNGSLKYFPSRPLNTSATVTIPLTTLPAGVFSAPGGLGWGTTYELNLTALTPNDTYNASLTLNYTTIGNALVHAYSQPFSFWYARDTSGDGLTDAEKARGWSVTTYTPQPYQYYTGPPIYWTAPVTANSASYATNGLVSDYVEKQLSLNPRTVDSAHSHMLDTWNLTFGLPGHGPSCPSGFQCWSENTTNPFASPQYPGGSGSGTANQVNRTNVTGAQSRVDDGTAYDATVIWANSRLPYLQGLVKNESIGWLRAVIGYYSLAHLWVLTVAGKLSWGANPLSYSTPADGIGDGQRVNPLGESFVNVTVTSWYDNVGSGNGVAAFINANQTVCCFNGLPYIQTDASLYTQQVTAGSGGSTYGGNLAMTYTFPVVDTQEYARLNISLVQNVGGTISTAAAAGPVDVDLANTGVHWLNHTGSNNIHVSYQAITVYAKAPTYILVPKDNSSLSNLPLGLKRYTAEQNFVLIVVNATGTTSYDRSVSAVPYPLANGTTSKGTYSVTLQAGLNNFLVPRGMFLGTPFGQDVLNATITPVQNTTGTLGNSVVDQYYNATQWLARATYGGHNGFNYTGTSGYITIYSNNQSQNCTGHGALCGGVPSNSNLESGHQSLAIQAIVTLNLSSHGAIADLLAGLLLNRSGNFTSWLIGATQFLPSLGIAPNVMDALANSVQPNAGGYPAPTSSGGNPLASWGTVGEVIWNAVSGVVGAIEVIWNAVVAAAAYLAYLATEALGFLLGALHQAAAVLKAVSSAILWALQQLATFLLTIVSSLLSAAFSPLTSRVLAQVTLMSLALSTAERSPRKGSDTIALGQFDAGVASILATMIVVGVIILIVSFTLSPEETILGPLAGVIFPLALTALGLASHAAAFQPPGPIQSTSPSGLVSLDSNLSSSYVSGVNATCPTSQTDINTQFAGTLILGSTFLASLITAMVVASIEPKYAAATELAGLGIGLGLLAVVIDAFTPAANVTLFGHAVTLSLLLSVFALILDSIAVGSALSTGAIEEEPVPTPVWVAIIVGYLFDFGSLGYVAYADTHLGACR